MTMECRRRNMIICTLLCTCFLMCCNVVAAEEQGCGGDDSCRNKKKALGLKEIAIPSIAVASFIGVFLPILGRRWAPLSPENSFFFIVKAFAAGVILATGFVHVLPDAFEALTNPCLPPSPWSTFPFAGFTAMTTAILTLLVDTLATSYYQRSHFGKNQDSSKSHGILDVAKEDNVDHEGHGILDVAKEDNVDHESHVHTHSHATHGHSHGSNTLDGDSDSAASKIRHRIISQVLELGIVAHSVIIGISLGASQSPCTIRPLVAALTFHQFFEGLGLGGCIVQAGFKNLTAVIMAVVFSLTTPLGIGVGIGILSQYNENSPKALAIEGLFDAASSGILIYMALVDLLAADFLSSQLQKKPLLQAGSYVSLLSGAGAMSVIAKWA